MSLTTHGHYDLTADREVGTRFILSIITVMVFIGILCLAAALGLLNMNKAWTGELRGVMTVEIPAMDGNGTARDANTRQQLQSDLIQELQALDGIGELRALPDSEIREKLEPWLGPAAREADLPLPSLIHIRLDRLSAENRVIEATAATIPDAVIDRHQKWMDDLSRLTRSLSLLALFLMALVGSTIIIAVSGAVRARLASHADEVDLLHLMGAQDHTIARQFRNHVLALAVKGCLIGFVMALAVLAGLSWLAHYLDLAIAELPALAWWHWGLLGLMPFAVLGLVSLTSGMTVLSVLRRMP